MSLDNHKIGEYSENVKDLPDYPSDEGYTAKRLKEIFDARSDKEIKEKHNALIDELSEIIAEHEAELSGKSTNEDISAAVAEHQNSIFAHNELFSNIRNELEALGEDKVDKIAGKGLSSNDYTDKEKAELETMAIGFPDLVKREELSDAYVARSHSCDVADAALNAQRADNAIADFNGNIIHETYVTKKELPEASVFFAEWSEFADTSNKAICDENGNTIHEVYATKQGLELAMQDSDAVYQVQFDSINASIGDISAALDELHTYAQALIGGDA